MEGIGKAALFPAEKSSIGCLMLWAGKLYVLNYSSHRKRTGTGTGTGTGLRVTSSSART